MYSSPNSESDPGGVITDAARAVDNLSPAQLAVLRELAEGGSNRQIAENLHLSQNTVKTHLKAIFRRLGVQTRLQAVLKVYRGG